MKKLIFLTLLIFSLLSSPVFSKEAEYFVKFKAGFDIPISLREELKVIREEKNLFSTKNSGIYDIYRENIEDFYEIKKVELLTFDDAELFSLPSDPEYKNQSHLALIKADSAYNIETYGNDIKVGVIDSGCFQHSDLKDNLLPGWNYIDSNDNTTDTYGHGTHVSGIIAASMNDIGVVGVSPKAKIIPLKCFDDKSGNPLDIITAIYDAVDVFECDILNMSLGILESAYINEKWSKYFKEAIEYAYEKGVIMIAAAGNYKTDELCYPAAYKEVIGVGSVDFDKSKSNFSQFNSSVTAVAPAPAGKVLSTCIKKDGETFKEAYLKTGGTSQASPQVAGMAAVAMSMKPNLTKEDFEELLKVTSEDLGDVGRDDYYGYGLINIEEMINKLFSDIPYYLSPINVDDEVAMVYIKNNSSHKLNATGIFSQYNNKQFLSLQKVNVELNKGEEKKIEFSFTGNIIRHYLWEKENNIVPVVKEREKSMVK